MTRDACHYAGHNQPRRRGPKHDGPHDTCQPCTHRHCRCCGIQHVRRGTRPGDPGDQTCPACIGHARSDLATIVARTRDLPDEAVEASTINGRLVAAQPIPGGDATVMLAGGSDARNQTYEILHDVTRRYTSDTRVAPHADDERSGDPEPPLQVLASWEDDWRLRLHQPAAGRATIAKAATYLAHHLTWAAQHHDAFDEFAETLRRVRGRLEDATGHGSSDQRGAACVHCGAVLVRVAATRKPRGCDGHHRGGVLACPWPRQGCCDRGGVDLEGAWRCPRCRREYDERTYRNAIRASYVLNAQALPALDLAARFGIAVGTIRVWAARGHLRKRGKGADGRTLYDVSDVERRARTEAVA